MTIYQICKILITAIGVYVAYRQLKNNTNAKKDDTQLTIKIETEHKLSEYKNLSIRELENNKVIKYLDTTDDVKPLSFEIIQKEIRKHPKIKGEIHTLLNYYESIIRGINNGLYNQKMVEDWGANRMKRAYRKFQRYIKERQINNPKAWELLSKYMEKNSK